LGRISTGGGRSSLTPNKDGKDLHLELRIFSNLKAFYRDKDIDIQDVMDLVKSAKRNDDPKAYW
jgi:hypothetical protein